jgi:tRNA pseudouridine38-40 synthase
LQNYKLVIEYDGTDFFGWQRQKQSSKTVQETIESSFKKVTGDDIRLIAAGRTDTGVHAMNQTANFKSENIYDGKGLIYSMNSVLPGSITVKKFTKVSKDFHARYSATGKEYIYQISKQKKSIGGNYFTILNYELDYGLIDELIQSFKGEHRFRSLCKNRDDRHDFRCDITGFKYKKSKGGNELVFSITANRFLHSMIRAVLGCVIDTARGKLEISDVKQKFIQGEKIKTTYLPAKGLILNKIFY